MTATYWEIGRRVVEFEQGGSKKAEYGERLIYRLSNDLTKRFGRGFMRRNLFQNNAFYIAFSEIVLQCLHNQYLLRNSHFPLKFNHQDSSVCLSDILPDM
jgi:hypothetical protein